MAWASCYTPEFRVVSILGAAVGTAAAADRRLVETVNGTPTFVLGGIDPGRYSLHCDTGATPTATYIGLANMTAGARYCGGLARIVIANFTAQKAEFARMVASTTTENIRLCSKATTGILQYTFDNGTTWTDSSFTLVAGQVYAVEMFVDWGTTATHTLKVRVDGVEVINVTGGAAIVTTAISGQVFLAGSLQLSINRIVDVADIASYNDVAEYGTIGANWRVYGIEPTSDGAHSMTANDFQDQASANLSNATTDSWSKVNDAPAAAPDVVNFVKQVVLRTTSYMEWVLRPVPAAIGTPVLVCLAAAVHPVGAATANSSQFRLNSGGNLSTEAAVDASLTADTLEYRKHHYTTEPTSGAAWTSDKVNALRARFGYSGDVSPPPALDAIMAFIVVPIQKSLVLPPRRSLLHRLTR